MPKGVKLMEIVCRKGLFGLLSGVLFLAAFTSAAADQGLEFSDAWVRAMPPGAGMTAAFGRLVNGGQEALEITGFTSPSFGDVSLHRTELVDGVSKMREVPALSIAPGEVVELKPGGYHLMLMMPKEEFLPGGHITVVMTASGGSSFRFDLPVQRR